MAKATKVKRDLPIGWVYEDSPSPKTKRARAVQTEEESAVKRKAPAQRELTTPNAKQNGDGISFSDNEHSTSLEALVARVRSGDGKITKTKNIQNMIATKFKIEFKDGEHTWQSLETIKQLGMLDDLSVFLKMYMRKKPESADPEFIAFFEAFLGTSLAMEDLVEEDLEEDEEDEEVNTEQTVNTEEEVNTEEDVKVEEEDSIVGEIKVDYVEEKCILE